MNPTVMSKLIPSISLLGRIASSALVLFSWTSISNAQQKDATVAPAQALTAAKTSADKKNDERAEQVLQRAIDVAGGNNFLAVQSITSRGLYTPFRDGVSIPPWKFVDYLVFPDRERTEIKGQGVRSIHTYTGRTGWTFDGMVKKISDLKPEQVKDFQIAMRTSLDNILRGWWRKEGAHLTYLGRREAGLAKRSEAVRLTYPDGFTVEFEFGAKDSLIIKTHYKRQTAEGEEVEEEDRYAQHLTIGSLMTPFVIDHYRAGVQTSRINYEKIEFNVPVPDSLFARPTDLKALK